MTGLLAILGFAVALVALPGSASARADMLGETWRITSSAGAMATKSKLSTKSFKIRSWSRNSGLPPPGEP